MPNGSAVISHWHHSVENFNTSTLDFLSAIEESLARKAAPVLPQRIEYRESGVFSDRREYLRISYGRYSFDVGAAPFGSDFFFSWWLVRRLPENAGLIGIGLLASGPIGLIVFVKVLGIIVGIGAFLLAFFVALLWIATGNASDAVEDGILSLPILGPLYLRFVKPVTYHSEDSRKMFEETVHRVVTRHVEALMTVSKLPPLTPEQLRVTGSASAS